MITFDSSNHIFKCNLKCAKVGHLLIVVGILFQLFTALTEKAEQPKLAIVFNEFCKITNKFRILNL